MLFSLRQASRLLASQAPGLPAAAALARAFTSQAGVLGGLLRQPLSLGSLFGMQHAAPAAAGVPPAPATLLGRHALTPPAAQALLNLQQQQPAPALLPELGELIGGVEGEQHGRPLFVYI